MQDELFVSPGCLVRTRHERLYRPFTLLTSRPFTAADKRSPECHCAEIDGVEVNGRLWAAQRRMATPSHIDPERSDVEFPGFCGHVDLTLAGAPWSYDAY